MTLTDLTPDGVRDEALTLLAEHLAHYAVLLSPLDSARGFGSPSVEEMRPTTLAHEAWALAHYAQTGADAETDSPAIAAEYASDRVLSVTVALDASPWRREGGTDPVCGPVDSAEGWPTTGIGLVCLAAWARIGLAEGRPLTARELAAVAGLSGPGSVRTLVQRGELARDADGEIEGAREWLSGRGVRGV